jgi:hypothetical protein
MTEELDALLQFRPTHLAWPIPPNVVERVGADDALLYLRGRKAEIEKSERDPLRCGYEPHIWNKVQWHIRDLRKKFPSGVIKIIIFGGNRSSKTRFAANYVNRDTASTPKRRWWCCDSTEAMSRTNQMRLIYEQFPPEWRNLPRSKITDVSYNLSDGFPKNRLVCPNASEVEFKFYSMDIGNLPGPELDGIWCDELVPLVWVETLVYRLINRNGILLITFTPELGWNETFGYFYEGAQALEETEAPLLPKYDEAGKLVGHKQVPRVMQCSDPTARILFFHTSDNPFGNYPALVQQLKNKSEEEILIRAYGVCTKSHSAAFPMFSKRAHVITTAQFLAITKEFPKGERTHLVDPCDGRMWFMIWVFCPSPNKWIIYREFPSYGHTAAYIQGIGMPGPWALSGAAADGVKGPAQDSKGFSLERYKEEIERQEGDELVLARYIDSRYATSPKSDHERMTTLQEQLTEVGIDFLCMTPGKGSILKTPTNTPDGSIDMINSALYYDVETELGEWSAELGRLNEPQLQVLETCPNTIYALEHWTGKDGQKGACKDPVDNVRGLFLTGVNYVGENQYVFKGGGIPR